MLDITLSAVQTENCYPYQLAAVISLLGNPEKNQGHYMTFLRIFGQWIRFSDTEMEAVEESAALYKLPRNREIPSNCYYPALCGRQLNK
jgi:hypothetical protein